MDIFQIYICQLCTVGTAFDRDLIFKTCDITEIKICKNSGTIDSNRYFFIICPVQSYSYFRILCRCRSSCSAIIWIICCTISLPEPATRIVTDHHTNCITCISKIYPKSSVGICLLHREFKISFFAEVKFIWIHKHCCVFSRTISIS